jgi:hypothetical protein
MKKLLLFTVYCLLFTVYFNAQVNLIPNPSFEQLDSCPNSQGQINLANPWFQPFTDSNGVQQSSTDLFSSCNNGSWGINNIMGSQLPRTGNSYVGASYFVGIVTYREYIEVKLNDSLLNSQTYCVTFYVSLADRCKYALSNFGVYFSNDSCLHVIPPDTTIPYTAQVLNSSSNIITDKDNWIPIELQYLAQGGENFITIGGFDPNNIITIGGGTTNCAYYHVEDVSVIDISTPAYAGVDTTITIGDSVFIGRQPEIGLNDDCFWYVNGSPIDTVAGLWVQPDSTTTYILEQTICGYTTYDTVKVTVLPTNINELFNSTHVSIYPNPSTGLFTIQLNNQHLNPATVQVIISNITGMIIKTEKISVQNNSANFNAEFSNGIYFIHVKSTDGYQFSPQRVTIIK